MTRKILLLGRNGQLGWELKRTLAPLGDVVPLGRAELDLTDFRAIREAVREIKPQLIVNAAAYTAVDRAETEPDVARAVNGTAPGVLAEEGRRVDAALVHVSTDYVFDGRKRSPYTEDDAPHPINVYGRSKLEGEQAVQAVGGAYLILRTSWLYGLRGKSFLLTILRRAEEAKALRVVDDQIGSPTWVGFLAEAVAQILSSSADPRGWIGPERAGATGIVHCAATGQTSWYGFARAIVESASDLGGRVGALAPITSAEYPSGVARPAYSALSTERLGSRYGICPPSWTDQLAVCLQAFRSGGGV